jgi:hypothetical protein
MFKRVKARQDFKLPDNKDDTGDMDEYHSNYLAGIHKMTEIEVIHSVIEEKLFIDCSILTLIHLVLRFPLPCMLDAHLANLQT